MIETHAHIYDDQFQVDLPEMLERATQAGIKEIWMPNCDTSTIPKMLALESPNILPMMGLHPCYVDNNVDKSLETIESWLGKRPFFMIGEIGLDFYWDLSFVPQQEAAFIYQLKLARQYNKPICIHSRNSRDGKQNAIIRCCELMEEHGHNGLAGIFHCFSGNLEEAQRVINLGFKLGIGGVSTFKNGGLDKVLPYIDLAHLVLETDSPYLAPVPHRGKRNEVSFLSLVAERVALLTGNKLDVVVNKTNENALNLKHIES